MNSLRFNLSSASQTGSSLLSNTANSAQNSIFNVASQGGKSVSLGLGSLTKTVSGAMSSLPPLPSLSAEADAKKKNEGKRAQLSFVMSLLEDVRLQSPQVHSGLVVAFTTATVSPVISSAIKFRWYKMQGGSSNDQFHQVDESSRAWYAPTADDIGCKICLQLEDTLGQGMSKYLEVRTCAAVLSRNIIETERGGLALY